jgi:nicotinate-nucleotide adenylyltransferase
MKRIGIYAGTFDPVHTGHIAFALQAIQSGFVDHVYFMPERRPRHRGGVEHYAHRIAMARQATRPHPKLHVLESDDISFTVKRTLTRLHAHFPRTQLVLLVGSDVLPYVVDWPDSDYLLKTTELMINLRPGQSAETIHHAIAGWAIRPPYQLIQAYAAHVSSHLIRRALRQREVVPGLLRSVSRYANHHWLYVSLA